MRLKFWQSEETKTAVIRSDDDNTRVQAVEPKAIEAATEPLKVEDDLSELTRLQQAAQVRKRQLKWEYLASYIAALALIPLINLPVWLWALNMHHAPSFLFMTRFNPLLWHIPFNVGESSQLGHTVYLHIAPWRIVFNVWTALLAGSRLLTWLQARATNRAIKALAATEDIRAVGPLVE